MKQDSGPASRRAWEDLILSMLAVSNYPLHRVLDIREDLRRRGLLDPSNLATWTVDRVEAELKQAGYDRGRLTDMYADRLVSLGKHAEVDRAISERVLIDGDDEQIREYLMPWHGIGKTVIGHFLGLRRSN